MKNLQELQKPTQLLKGLLQQKFRQQVGERELQLIAMNQTLKPLCLYLCYKTILGTKLLNSRTLVFIYRLGLW